MTHAEAPGDQVGYAQRVREAFRDVPIVIGSRAPERAREAADRARAAITRGSFEGRVNQDAVAAIVAVAAAAGVPVQLGGGIRDDAAIERWLDAGIARVLARLGLNSFVTTLGMATLLGGLIQWYTGGQTILAGQGLYASVIRPVESSLEQYFLEVTGGIAA